MVSEKLINTVMQARPHGQQDMAAWIAERLAFLETIKEDIRSVNLQREVAQKRYFEEEKKLRGEIEAHQFRCPHYTRILHNGSIAPDSWEECEVCGKNLTSQEEYRKS